MRVKKAFAALITTCAVAFTVAIAPTPAQADSWPQWNVWYISVFKPTSGLPTMVMDVTNGSSANMTPVQLWELRTSGNTLNQQWLVRSKQIDASGNYGYEIVNRGSGKCLDRRSDLGLGNGNAVQQYDCTGASNQIWWPAAVGTSNWVMLKNGADRRCLDVRDVRYANGAPLQVWDCSGNWNQRWNIY
ncbi:RICIN domain-containing protein [Micromonospora sp. NPDC093277]|uniref:RICIN domain-containing protein n=1 Tax=Micromonospora sp. NPDC093277 TaxID=3364291 RepID=UPI0037F6E0A4